MSKGILVSLVLLMFLCTGCASIVSESKYPVTITSSPTGAMVTVKNRSGMEIHRAATPTTVTLAASDGYFKKARYTLEFQKEGCCPATTTEAAGLDGWYWGNILFGGLIGMLIVDPATGAMWKLDEHVGVVLQEDRATPAASAGLTTQ